ncbi:MAG: benzoate-CoA ligase family protein [Candidatus Limnocylindrales bacterium]|nr:benzoate-CoA ligase family protein [Candidatus Limnocylindrales bacterium]
MRTAADVPLYYNAVDILERNLGARADKVALYSPDRSLTFRQVSREVNQVGNALINNLGVRLGDFVAILSLDRPEWVASFFGIVKAGGVAVSINTMVTPRECDYILRDCRARVLIVDESLLPAIEGIRDSQPFLEHVVVIGRSARGSDLAYSELIGDQATELAAAPTHRDDPCMLNYSSGTTGEPKGIPHAQKDLPLTAQLYAVDAIGLREDDRTFSVAKLFFTYGSGGNLIWPWYAGASVILSAAPSRVATNLLETIARFKPTVFNGVPTSYASMLAVDRFAENHDLSSIRLCLSAGESLPVAIWHDWKRRTGHEIVEGIGTTENFALYLTNRLGEARPGSVGKPVEGYEIKIVDDDGQPVPRGETGNLILRGETAALHYLHQYERSRRTFLGEWLATGDRFYVDGEGYHWYVGRSDDMLKVGGIWVSPLEIENTLTGHDAVLESAVIGHPDQSDLIKPKAFVVLQSGYSPSEGMARDLIAYCAREMAAFKRPRWIEFVDELPRTATGKLQRSKLR